MALAPRSYQSSKTCSNCRGVNAKLKRERCWQCPSSRALHERNHDAAVNMRHLDQTLTRPVGDGVTLRDAKALAVDMTAEEAQEFANKGWKPWESVATALREIEASE